jgi:16S rRNA processing protein RimM
LSNEAPKTFSAGWVKDAHGLKGELYIQLFAKKADWLSSFKEFWLRPKAGGNLEAFPVVHSKPHRDGLIVRTAQIIDRTQAEKYKGFTFLIPNSYLQAQAGDTIFLKQVLGFTVKDGEREVGIIEGFSTNGAQDLLNVKSASKEVLIPFVSAFIKQIDFDNRVVIMELPAGLEDEG